jgi:lysozyme
MIIKTPAVYDTSHWERIPDFAKLSPRPVLVITKATEGTAFVDSAFVPYFIDLRQDGIRRGAYHFFRKAYNSVQQAEHFCNTIGTHVANEDILALDVEEGGETAAQLIEWLDAVEKRFPRNLILIYSRKNILDSIAMTSIQKTRMKKYHTWVAGYPFNPDTFNFVPSFYIPDQTKYGTVWLWQYTDRGVPQGASGDGTDCNWIAPEFLAWLGASNPQPEPELTKAKIMLFENGITRTFEEV